MGNTDNYDENDSVRVGGPRGNSISLHWPWLTTHHPTSVATAAALQRHNPAAGYGAKSFLDIALLVGHKNPTISQHISRFIDSS